MSLKILRSVFAVMLLGSGMLLAPHAHAAAKSIHLSNNWAGYATTSGSYTGVAATWTVPTSVAVDQHLAADAAWVGIGGLSQSDLIQAGTQAIVQNGHTSYQAWYEILPDVEHTLPIAIRSGDLVSTSLQETSPNIWHLIFINQTTAQIYQADIPYVSSHSSAEWIVERPLAITGSDSSYLTLSDFDTVNFVGATVSASGTTTALDGVSALPIIMGNNSSQILATPGDVRGGAFAVSYLSRSQSASYLRMLHRSYRVVTPSTDTSSQTRVSTQTSSDYSSQTVTQMVTTTGPGYVIHIVF